MHPGGGMSKRERTGRRYRKLVMRQRSLGLPCWICGEPIRYDLRTPHPLSFEYDHFYPASRWQEFGYASQYDCIHDEANGRSSHRSCNERRQDSMPWEPRWQGVKKLRKPPAPPSKPSRAN